MKVTENFSIGLGKSIGCLNICPALSSDFGLDLDNYLKIVNIALKLKTRFNTKIINKSCTIHLFITYRGIAKAKSIS